jgi:ribosomal-protein-alanine N-acetyltransferase
MAHPGWPARLAEGPVGLRPLRLRDAAVWSDIRRRNRDWLEPWEATPPGGEYVYATSPSTYIGMARRLTRQARRGEALPFAITYHGAFVGQLTIGNIVGGSLNSGYAGYWVDQRVAGRGVMPTALALAVDHCFSVVGLHRIEVNIRPENLPSRRVVEKLGFREEGLRIALLHIAGDYRDHLSYAMVREDVRGGLLRRWLADR